jgi:hypothetical protein
VLQLENHSHSKAKARELESWKHESQSPYRGGPCTRSRAWLQIPGAGCRGSSSPTGNRYLLPRGRRAGVGKRLRGERRGPAIHGCGPHKRMRQGSGAGCRWSGALAIGTWLRGARGPRFTAAVRPGAQAHAKGPPKRPTSACFESGAGRGSSALGWHMVKGGAGPVIHGGYPPRRPSACSQDRAANLRRLPRERRAGDWHMFRGGPGPAIRGGGAPRSPRMRCLKNSAKRGHAPATIRIA